MEETTITTINSTSDDKNGLTLSTSSAPITTSTARSSTTSKVASSTAITTTEETEHQGTSTTAHLTDVSLQTQTSTEPITVRYVVKTLTIRKINLIFSETTGEKKSTRRLVVTACYILLVFLFFCGIGN